jgi:hypothetical protein
MMSEEDMYEDRYLDSLYEEKYEYDYQFDDGIELCPECEYVIQDCECENF